ncbi:hypothetical protein VNO80_09520 [Phaseolus coccineus]|uniref:Uncharacterized protein n=1 Tax=Phaseolus coccineus TaxID=3886 RepID=A0AAN9NCQ6_PHACN
MCAVVSSRRELKSGRKEGKGRRDYGNDPASPAQHQLQEGAVTIAIGLTRTVHGRVLQSALHKENTIIIAFRSKKPDLQFNYQTFSLPLSYPL